MANTTMTGGSDAAGQIRTASGINVVLGVWLIIAPFVLGSSGQALWNDIIVGLLVLILAGTRVFKPTVGTKSASWTNAVIGIWLIAAPFLLAYPSAEALWNDLIVGALILIFALWSAALPRRGAAADIDRARASTRNPEDQPIGRPKM